MSRNLLVFILSFCFATAFVSLISGQKTLPESAASPNTAEHNSSKSQGVNDVTAVGSANLPAPQAVNAPRFWGAGVETDREVLDLFIKFREAVAIGDKATVASLMDYPLRVNFPRDPDSKGYTFIRNRRSFARLYDRIFDEKLRAFISDVNPETDDIWARYDGIAIGRGVIWIGVFCNDRKCSGRYRLAVRTIHSNSHLMDTLNR